MSKVIYDRYIIAIRYKQLNNEPSSRNATNSTNQRIRSDYGDNRSSKARDNGPRDLSLCDGCGIAGHKRSVCRHRRHFGFNAGDGPWARSRAAERFVAAGFHRIVSEQRLNDREREMAKDSRPQSHELHHRRQVTAGSVIGEIAITNQEGARTTIGDQRSR
jgi:hypothetical protein